LQIQEGKMSGFKAPNYTQVPNDFFDMVKDMGDAELRVTLIMIRETIGYHRDAAKVGMKELSERAGLSYNGTGAGCEAAEKRGTFQRTNPDEKRQAEWALNVETPSASEGDFGKDPQPVRETPSASEGQVRLNKGKEKELNKGNQSSKRNGVDALGGWLELSRTGAERAAAAEAVLVELERGLKINIKRDTNSADKAARILRDGRPVSSWIDWYRSDNFRLSGMHFMNIDKVWSMWPSAFQDAMAISMNGEVHV
jgi:hypothetical protein